MRSDVGWWVIIPIKDPSRGKTRLVAPTGVDHAALADAMAADTILAVSQCVGVARVVVVGHLPPAVDDAVTIVEDPRAGLNAAVRQGLSYAEDAGAVDRAVLLGDHPSLDAPSLDDALSRCAAYDAAIVADASDDGTALLTARRGVTLEPSFGPGSALRHRRWATTVELASPRLRLDVDDAADLVAAALLGLGPRTAALLAGGAGRHATTAGQD